MSDDGSADPTTDDGYVHDPGTVGDQPRNTPTQAQPAEEFDWRGWLLVAAVVVTFLVVPGLLYVLPAVRGAVAALGLGLRNTYLILPLVPALGLGAVAVWAAIRARA